MDGGRSGRRRRAAAAGSRGSEGERGTPAEIFRSWDFRASWPASSAPVVASVPELHVLTMAASALPNLGRPPPAPAFGTPTPPLVSGGPTPPTGGKAHRGRPAPPKGPPRDPNGVPLTARDVPSNFTAYDPADLGGGSFSARGVPGHPARRSAGTA
eukprot:tig00000158_g10186.t1